MGKEGNIYERFPVLREIPEERFPKNIFIIPDGNGRWAKKRGSYVTTGHKKGFEVAENILNDIAQLKAVESVGLWGFACDNWKRETREVGALMHIFSLMVDKELKKLTERKGRFIHLGRKDRIPGSLSKKIERAERATEHNEGQIVYIAIDFGGEDQNLRMMEEARKHPEIELTKDNLWAFRDGGGAIKAADLLIRTSGERRTSDVGWLNGGPTELYFIDKLFPDITSEDIVEAIVVFSKRDRRLGGRPKIQ